MSPAAETRSIQPFMREETTYTADGDDWLYFFFKSGRQRTRARISRRALERCFRSAAGESLVNIYAENVDVIEERARVRLAALGPSGANTLISLDARDFENLRRAMYADLVSLPELEHAARELAGRFTADELEAVALWMRRRSRAGG
jgi:hypothetical protein